MGKIYLLLLFVICAGPLGSQTIINRTLDHHNDFGSSLVRINNNTYFNSEVYGELIDSTIINGLDASGQTLFRKGIARHNFTSTVKMIRTLDNQLALIGYYFGCDYIDNTSRTFFTKLGATLGNTIFDRTLQPDGNTDNFRDFVQYSDSTYFMISDSLLFHFSKTGAQYTRRNTGFSSLTSISINADGNLVFTSQVPFGSNTLYVTDTAASLLSQHTYSNPITSILHKTTSCYYTLNGTIQKRDTSMAITASSAIAQDSINGNLISDFYLANDTVYACGYNTNANTSFILRMDTLLNLLDSSVNLSPGIAPRRIVHDTKTTLLINSQSMPSANALNGTAVSNGIVGIYTMPDNGTFAFTKDVGVVAVAMDSGYVSTYPSYYPPSGGYIYELTNRYYKIKVTVKNFGTSPVQTLQINHFIGLFVGCGYNGFYTGSFSNLHLNPGDTAVLDLGWIHAYYNGIPFFSLPSSVPVNLCFYTSIPNHEHDKLRTNDQTCATFNLAVSVIGMDEKSDTAPIVDLYPNPTNDVFSIAGNVRISQATISDVSGRTIQQYESPEVIDLGAYEAGIYFVRLKTDKGLAVKKIIKE